PAAHALAHVSKLARELEQPLLVDVAYDRHDEPVRRVYRDTDVIVLLEDQAFAVRRKRRVELGKLFQRDHRRFHQEAQDRKAYALGLGLSGLGFSESLELGHVRFVVLRDVRNGKPVTMQERARELLDAGQRLRGDGSELREIDVRRRREIETESA